MTMISNSTIRTYSELITLPTFEERYEYLRLNGRIGEETFGYDRYLNQLLYTSNRWRRIRNKVIVRDDGCDLGIDDRRIGGIIIVHHMNPITIEDVLEERPEVFDPEFLISVADPTHKAIHYGDASLLMQTPIERSKYDTCPWRR